jgi:tetratricopeptide (TPR) repeat protein
LNQRALDTANQTGDRRQMGLATAALSAMLNAQFRADDALALVDGALEEYADVDDEVMAELGLSLGRARYSTSDVRGSLEILEQTLELAEKHGFLSVIAEALLARGNALGQLGRRREAFGTFRMAAELGSDNGLTWAHLRSTANSTGLLAETDVEASVQGWRDLIGLARKAGHRAMLLNGTANLGYTAFLAGEWDEAMTLLDPLLAEDMAARDRLVMLNNALIIRASRGESIANGLAEMESIGSVMSGSWHLYVADPEANAAMAAGDLKSALDNYREIAEDDPSQGPEYFYRAARAALWNRDAASAGELLTRFEESGGYGRIIDARHATLRAGLAALDGRSAEALALYREALRDWRAAGAVWDEALTGVDMAELLDPADPDVATVIASARAILERLRAKPYIERLDAAVAHGSAEAPTRPRAHGTARTEVAVTD